MFKRRLLVLIPVIALLSVSISLADSVKRITADELNAMLGDPNTTIVDVRHGTDWTDSDVKIKGAVREDPAYVKDWADKYAKDVHLVLY